MVTKPAHDHARSRNTGDPMLGREHRLSLHKPTGPQTTAEAAWPALSWGNSLPLASGSWAGSLHLALD